MREDDSGHKVGKRFHYMTVLTEHPRADPESFVRGGPTFDVFFCFVFLRGEGI